MRRPRATIFQLVVLMPVAAVLAREPREWDGPIEVVATFAIGALLPSVVLGLDWKRSRLVVAASAAVVLAQVLLDVPPNRAGVVGCVAIALIGQFARDTRDLASALLAVGVGVGVCVAIAYDPCTPIAPILGPLVGLAVRRATRRAPEAVESDPVREPLPEFRGL
jgi:hypothetical protein